jgi:hypothetical protein
MEQPGHLTCLNIERTSSLTLTTTQPISNELFYWSLALRIDGNRKVNRIRE